MIGRAGTLRRILSELLADYDREIACASVYRTGLRTSLEGKPSPMLIRETDCEKADRVERMLGPRIARLRRLLGERAQ